MNRFTRSCRFAALLMGMALSPAVLAQDSSYRPNGQQIPPPACYTLMESFGGSAGRTGAGSLLGAITSGLAE